MERALGAGVILAMLGGCSTPSAPPPPAGTTAVVVGVQSEPLAGGIDVVQIVTSVGGMPRSDERLDVARLPHEVKLVPPAPGDTAAGIEVNVSGFATSVGPAPLLLRTAETSFVPGQTRLLRVLVQGSCLLGLPGLSGAPMCVAPQTCLNGTCQDDRVDPQSLEPYTTDWAVNTPDYCKPLNPGPPAVQVGTGQTDYLPLTDGQTIQAELGPQGGHHVWIAVRQQNLKATGSTTTITSAQPGGGTPGPKAAFVFTFNPDQGGFCKLYGLRYQLDLDGADYHLFLGKPLDVTVVVADPSGATGTGVAHVNIAPTLLCPTGSDGGC
jgi:hypothetical protein